MASKYVIDSNIFIKILIEEKDSPLAKDFLTHCLEEESILLVPSLFPYEIFHVAWKKGYCMRAISEHLKKNRQLKIMELSPGLIHKSVELIEQATHPKSGIPSFYDASYHALAILNNCDFITADKRHYKKTRDLGNIRLLSEVELKPIIS